MDALTPGAVMQRVHINYTVDVDEGFRRAIRRYYGREGLANRDEVKAWFRAYGESMNLDLAAYGPEEGGRSHE